MDTKIFNIDYLNPVLPLYENTKIPISAVAYKTESGKTVTGESICYKPDSGVVIKDGMLFVGKAGVYKLEISFEKQIAFIVVISVPSAINEKSYEASIFEYDFNGKSFEDISRYWVLQRRNHAIATFKAPATPQISATESLTDGFVPFVAQYKDAVGQIRHNNINHKKCIADVGFMYLKSDNIPCLLSNYNIYLDGMLINTAINIPEDTVPSANAAAGIVGRITLSDDGIIDYKSKFQATLSTIRNHPAYKIDGNYAHRNFYLSEQLFMPWSYNSHSSEFYGCDNADIGVGDDFSLYASFGCNSITSGIKKGTMASSDKYSRRQITKDCYYLSNNINYCLDNQKECYVCQDNGICIQNIGSVGFAYNGAETAINKFKVTYTVDTNTIIRGEWHNIDIIYKEAIPDSYIPKRTTQKEINVFESSTIQHVVDNHNFLNFTIMSDQHFDASKYNCQNTSYALIRDNFMSVLNTSDSNFVLMTGDNTRWALDYNINNIIDGLSHLNTFYSVISRAPRKAFYVLQGNHDHCTTEYPDRFVLKTDVATFICFNSLYVQFKCNDSRHYIPSAGKMTEELLHWIRGECKKILKENENATIIFVNHFSAQNNEEKFSGNMRDDGCYELAEIQLETLRRNELLDIITQYGVQLYISGHEHCDEMNFEEITYQNGFKTGCINYSVGLNPIACEIHGNTVAFKQYDYASFKSIPESIDDAVCKRVIFSLRDKKSDRLENAKNFYSALEELKKIYSGRFEGLYRYSFQYCGEKQENGKRYYGFKVYYLRYYIHNGEKPITIYAFPDSEKKGADLKTHITDIYITANGDVL